MSSPSEFVDYQGFESIGLLQNSSIELTVTDEQDFQKIKMVAELIAQVSTNKSSRDANIEVSVRHKEITDAIARIVDNHSKGNEQLAAYLRKELEQYVPYFTRLDCNQVSLDVDLVHGDDGGLSDEAEETLKKELLSVLSLDRLSIGRFLSKAEQHSLDAPLEDRGAFDTWMAKM